MLPSRPPRDLAPTSPAGYLERWYRLVDRLIPGAIRQADPETLRRARLVITFWIGVNIWVPPLYLILPRIGVPSLIRPLQVSILLGLVTPTLLWRTKSVGIAGNYFTACLFACLTYFAIGSGGLHSPTLLWQPVMIMAAGTLVGTRSAFLWAGIGLTNIATFLVLEQHGVTHASPSGAASERLFLAVGLASVNVLVLLLTQLYESYKNVAFSALQTARIETEAARLKAEDASRAKSQFLANMSHEIRTPLNAVLGMTSLLLDTRLDETQQDYVETAHASGEHLLTVINDILDFSKIEAGRLDLDHAPFAVRDVVDDSLDVVALAAGKKELEISALVEPDVPDSLEGDSGRLRQVLVNLLSNAIKFTDEGEVTLAVAARALDEPGNFEITFTVRDTGIGIAAEHREMLFAVFTQVDGSPTRRHGGTGLGLAISKRLVEMMGGRIWLESTPDQGSTFTFTIRALRTAPVTERIDGSARLKLAGRRVLIVDDNGTNRRILNAFTASWGMVPRDTPSPSEALRWLAAGEPFDVAILDFQMPEMDGSELAVRIRRIPGLESFPIVLATSSLGRSAKETAEAAPGFTAYLVKPVRRAQLIALLARVLMNLPAIEVPAAAEATPAAEPPRAAPPPSPPADDGSVALLRVLLVEDNKMNQKVAIAMLARLGLVADLAGDGSQAIAAIATKRYDVVLMDVQMPVMDGLTAARAICQRWAARDRPRLIAMTANAMTGDEQRCKDAGMDDYVSKPVKLEELAAALRRNIQLSSGRQALNVRWLAPSPAPARCGRALRRR